LLVEVLPRPAKKTRLQALGSSIKSFFMGEQEAAPLPQQEVIAMIDGDAFGTTPMQIEVIPQAVSILVPERRP
jgi:diacylglycerol kinase family enzyme